MNRSRVQVPSSFPPAPIAGGNVQRKRRARRSIETILHDAQTPLEEAVYAINRVAGLRLRMAHVLGNLSPEAQSLVKDQMPELRHLLPGPNS